MQTTVAPTPHVRWWGLTITIASLLAIGFATMLPERGQHPGQHFCLVCGSFGGVDALLNIILFVPLGIGLALSGFAGKRALLAAFGVSVLIETAQLFFIPGRDATIGDVLTNTVGGGCGFALARYAWTWLRPSQRIASILTIGWAAAWLAIQSLANYGFAPSLPESPYYGQLARAIGNFAVFEGSVIASGVGDVAIPNSIFPDSHALRLGLINGAPVEATVTAAQPTEKIAPIVRIADSAQREIALLAQQGTTLVFAVRSGAAVLRLRRPLFALPDAFPAEAGSASHSRSDTLSLSGGYTSESVAMAAQTRSTIKRTRIPLAASRSWALVLPFDWLIQGTRGESILSLMWTAVLLIPFGYWATYINWNRSGERRGFAALTPPFLAMLPLFAVGFVLVPHLFHLPNASPAELFWAFLGVLIGSSLAFVARVSKAARPS